MPIVPRALVLEFWRVVQVWRRGVGNEAPCLLGEKTRYMPGSLRWGLGDDSSSSRLERQLSLLDYFRVLTGGRCLLDLPWHMRSCGRGTVSGLGMGML